MVAVAVRGCSGANWGIMKRGLIAAWIIACCAFPLSVSCADDNLDLIEASAFGDAEKVQQLVSAGANVNTPDDKGCPPIIMAARSGDVDTIKTLLNNGADVDARDMYEMTPLMHASLSGNANAVKFLISRGADVHARAKSGKTAIDWSSKKSITRLLKNHDANNGR